MKTQKTKTKSNKHLFFLIPTLTLIIAGSTFYLMTILNKQNDSSNEIDPSINYDKPTTAEIDAGQAIKDANQQNAIDETNHANKASVFIVDASQQGDTVEVRAYVTGVAEDGGTCQYQFQSAQQNQVLNKTSPASFNTTSTTCESITIPISEFVSSGTWSLTVSYTSNTTAATPANISLEVIK